MGLTPEPVWTIYKKKKKKKFFAPTRIRTPSTGSLLSPYLQSSHSNSYAAYEFESTQLCFVLLLSFLFYGCFNFMYFLMCVCVLFCDMYILILSAFCLCIYIYCVVVILWFCVIVMFCSCFMLFLFLSALV
jgi:hypothetical protein